eukprot:GHVR01192583.1.p1 GENE.GHVR01192583.1~~GHVR01192583.1.p1  ORF type:complete len:279 (+),score=95.79 GHVR01192583.1:46-882(+)
MSTRVEETSMYRRLYSPRPFHTHPEYSPRPFKNPNEPRYASPNSPHNTYSALHIRRRCVSPTKEYVPSAYASQHLRRNRRYMQQSSRWGHPEPEVVSISFRPQQPMVYPVEYMRLNQWPPYTTSPYSPPGYPQPAPPMSRARTPPRKPKKKRGGRGRHPHRQRDDNDCAYPVTAETDREDSDQDKHNQPHTHTNTEFDMWDPSSFPNSTHTHTPCGFPLAHTHTRSSAGELSLHTHTQKKESFASIGLLADDHYDTHTHTDTHTEVQHQLYLLIRDTH